jgi:cytochrome c-type biogenesis protein CcmH
MLLGVVLAGLTIVVLAAVLLPIIRRARAAPERAQYDRAVYRDQLEELDRDVARGLIGEREAQSARIEIQRRMLASDTASPPARRAASPVLAGALCLLVVAFTGGLYLLLGSPGVPDEPYAARVLPNAAAGRHDVENAAAELAAKLKTDPTNKDGWLLYARTTAALGDWQHSVDAYHHAIELGADDADVGASYGEALVMAADGMVTPAAHDAFAAALAKQPDDAVARFYLALGDAQAGEAKQAIDAWVALAAEAPDGSAMRDELVRRITDTAKAAGLPMPALPAAPPTQDQIQGMVAALAAKLQANPNDADGWLRLGRSYGVMGDTGKSADAYDHAAKLRPDDATIPLQEAEALLASRAQGSPIPPRAIELLHRVEATLPNQPEVLWYLGVAAAQDHRLEEAEHYWQRLLPLLPADGTDRKMVGEALDALKGK